MRLLEALGPLLIRAGCAFSHTSPALPAGHVLRPRQEHHHYYYPAAHDGGHYREGGGSGAEQLALKAKGFLGLFLELLLLLRFRLK